MSQTWPWHLGRKAPSRVHADHSLSTVARSCAERLMGGHPISSSQTSSEADFGDEGPGPVQGHQVRSWWSRTQTQSSDSKAVFFITVSSQIVSFWTKAGPQLTNERPISKRQVNPCYWQKAPSPSGLEAPLQRRAFPYSSLIGFLDK